ncbi:MAG TPA: sigma-54-dependent Fis family transcriptional regulator [Spirochaetia bacterium]|nr:sigma-54-dependent Fis family transcriptional regulator [Spirochaetia bacterium]
MISVLFIDDDVQAHKTLRMIMPDDFRIISAFSGEHGLEILKNDHPDAVLLDIELPGIDGHEVLTRIVAEQGAPPVIMLSAQSDVAGVVKAVQTGAYDYIVKPYDVAALQGTIVQAVSNARRVGPGAVDGQAEAGKRLIGQSDAMRRVRDLVARFAAHHSPVIVSGPSGSGKELVAEAIHDLSPRSGGPFVALNCGAIPLTLIETELFGAERGAYTDARSRPGSFERASGGTLFLDEIGEMPPDAQVKLLRVLEEKRVVRVGGTDVIDVNVRIVAATNRDLKLLVGEGKFREDLYYRISVLPISLPTLTEREDDIVHLALWFLHRMSEGKKRLAEDAREKLMRHAWPGNVRELKNVMERAMVFAEGDTVRAKDIVF